MENTTTTICSTMFCYNRTTVTNIPRDGKWWDQIANPAPFCEPCKKKTGVNK